MCVGCRGSLSLGWDWGFRLRPASWAHIVGTSRQSRGWGFKTKTQENSWWTRKQPNQTILENVSFLKPYLIHYGFELHPATEKMDNKVNKGTRSTQRNKQGWCGNCWASFSAMQHWPAAPGLGSAHHTNPAGNPCNLGILTAQGRFTAYWKGCYQKGKRAQNKKNQQQHCLHSPALHARVPGVDRAQPQGTTPKPQTLNPPRSSSSTPRVKQLHKPLQPPKQLHTSAPTQSPLLFQAHSHREFGIWAVFSHKCHLMPRAQHNSRAMHKRELSSDKQHCTAFLTCLLHYPKVQTAKGKYPGTVWVQSKNMHYRG